MRRIGYRDHAITTKTDRVEKTMAIFQVLRGAQMKIIESDQTMTAGQQRAYFLTVEAMRCLHTFRHSSAQSRRDTAALLRQARAADRNVTLGVWRAWI